MKKLLVLLVYMTVCGTPGEVDHLVNGYLDNGWELYGNPTLVVWAEQLNDCQVLTKKPKPITFHYKRHVAPGVYK